MLFLTGKHVAILRWKEDFFSAGKPAHSSIVYHFTDSGQERVRSTEVVAEPIESLAKNEEEAEMAFSASNRLCVTKFIKYLFLVLVVLSR